MKTYTYKKFKYKDKIFRFKEPLKVVIDNFLCYDLKTVKGELYIPSVMDGYTGKEIKNPEKAIKEFLTYVFDELISKKDDELSIDEQLYKEKYIQLIDLSKL